jgi:murein DD-endopeptidase MepM/ murein hydrolase activator NlpD
MIKFLLVLLLFFTFVHAKTSVDNKIKKTSSSIKLSSKIYLRLNKKMADTANAILKQKKEILKQNKLLKKLKSELLSKEKIYVSNTKQLLKLQTNKIALKTNRDRLEQNLVFTIAQSVSLSLMLEEDYVANEESLIEYEVLKIMLKNSKKMVKKLNKIFYNNTKEIDLMSVNIDSLKKSIKDIRSKKTKLMKIQVINKKALTKLTSAKTSYKKELKKLLSKQDMLKNTLARLNIIKIDEIEKAKREANRARAFNSKVILNNTNLPKVKKHGSSYQKIKTRKYRGKKTIAPFKPYTITKKYGTYKDPIYGIKVFNESISLKPKKKNTKVKAVFNGKVIYADKTAVLNNIVIIEHKDGLHTIYANLSKIAPNIKKGKTIRKGYALGRVNNELIFEVTQKTYHINPIRLFR